MKNEITETKPPTKKEIIQSGRVELQRMLQKALDNGEIYYAITSVSRSGMHRTIQLSYLDTDSEGKPYVAMVWPRMESEVADRVQDYSKSLEIVAKDWGFSFKRRAFAIGGCGMDMVFALVYNLCFTAFDTSEAGKVANKLRRTSLINT